VIYTHGQAETAGAFQTDAKVPVSLIKEGMEVEARMQELCYDPARNERFPSLFAAGRPGRSRKKKTEPAGAEEGGAAGEG